MGTPREGQLPPSRILEDASAPNISGHFAVVKITPGPSTLNPDSNPMRLTKEEESEVTTCQSHSESQSCKWQRRDSTSLPQGSVFCSSAWPSSKRLPTGAALDWSLEECTSTTLSGCHLRSGRDEEETQPGEGAEGPSPGDEQPPAVALRGRLPGSVMRPQVPQGGSRGSVNPLTP